MPSATLAESAVALRERVMGPSYHSRNCLRSEKKFFATASTMHLGVGSFGVRKSAYV